MTEHKRGGTIPVHKYTARAGDQLGDVVVGEHPFMPSLAHGAQQGKRHEYAGRAVLGAVGKAFGTIGSPPTVKLASITLGPAIEQASTSEQPFTWKLMSEAGATVYPVPGGATFASRTAGTCTHTMLNGVGLLECKRCANLSGYTTYRWDPAPTYMSPRVPYKLSALNTSAKFMALSNNLCMEYKGDTKSAAPTKRDITSLPRNLCIDPMIALMYGWDYGQPPENEMCGLIKYRTLPLSYEDMGRDGPSPLRHTVMDTTLPLEKSTRPMQTTRSLSYTKARQRAAILAEIYGEHPKPKVRPTHTQTHPKQKMRFPKHQRRHQYRPKMGARRSH